VFECGNVLFCKGVSSTPRVLSIADVEEVSISFPGLVASK
jgi:hypothetical protein